MELRTKHTPHALTQQLTVCSRRKKRSPQSRSRNLDSTNCCAEGRSLRRVDLLILWHLFTCYILQFILHNDGAFCFLTRGRCLIMSRRLVIFKKDIPAFPLRWILSWSHTFKWCGRSADFNIASSILVQVWGYNTEYIIKLNKHLKWKQY